MIAPVHPAGTPSAAESPPARARGHDIVDPFFVVGPGRAGTTLMARLLASHSRLTVTPETHYMKRAKWGGSAAAPEPTDFEDYWARYTRASRFKDLGVDERSCLERIDELGGRTFRNTFAAVLLNYGERTGKARVGEKTPGHVYFLEQLFSWFPAARVVLMIRDPRAVVASQLRSPWVRVEPPTLRSGLLLHSRLHQTIRYARDWNAIHAIAQRWQWQPQVHVQSYESLVKAPEEALREVCRFLGEGYEPGMLTAGDAAEQLPAGTAEVYRDRWGDWIERHHRKAAQAVSSESLDKWRDQLSSLEVALIEGLCRRRMMAQGYALSFGPGAAAAARAAAELIRLLRSAEQKMRAQAAILLRR